MSTSKQMDVDLDLIDLGERLRDVDQAAAQSLALSMRERGQLQDIELRAKGDGRYQLNIGAHRYVAAQILAWPTIRAVVVDCSDDEAKLREIDENLYRQELTPFDQANFLEERRQIWEKLHGKVKRGGDRRSKAQVEPLIDGMGRGSSFVKETAEKFGLPASAVKRALTRKAQIAPKVWAVLRTTEAARNGALLDKIRKLEIEDQIAISDRVTERGCTVQEAVRVTLQKPEIDIDERDRAALEAAWKRASAAVRAAFLKDVGGKK